LVVVQLGLSSLQARLAQGLPVSASSSGLGIRLVPKHIMVATSLPMPLSMQLEVTHVPFAQLPPGVHTAVVVVVAEVRVDVV
jgi:hypothetical protein